MLGIRQVPARELFITPEFKQSAWAMRIAEEAGEVFITEQPMKPGHFGTFFGALQTRRFGPHGYDNPYRSDLYHLHEMVHVTSWREGRRKLKAEGKWNLQQHGERETFNEWLARICESERLASLTSECFVYLHIPAIRRKVFTTHPIWLDRFIDLTGDHGPIDDEQREQLQEQVDLARTSVLNSTSYDYIEAQIKHFHFQNVQWCRIWAMPVGGNDPANAGPYADKPAYRVVEEHMAQMDERPNLDEHQRWLEDVTVTANPRCTNEIRLPFAYQAEAFMPYYYQTREEYGNEALET